MSARKIHGAPGTPTFRARAYEGTSSYLADRRGTESSRAKSSSNANNTSNAWNVNFNNGNVNNNDKTNNNYVRCVLSGTWILLCLAGREMRP